MCCLNALSAENPEGGLSSCQALWEFGNCIPGSKHHLPPLQLWLGILVLPWFPILGYPQGTTVDVTPPITSTDLPFPIALSEHLIIAWNAVSLVMRLNFLCAWTQTHTVNVASGWVCTETCTCRKQNANTWGWQTTKAISPAFHIFQISSCHLHWANPRTNNLAISYREKYFDSHPMMMWSVWNAEKVKGKGRPFTGLEHSSVPISQCSADGSPSCTCALWLSLMNCYIIIPVQESSSI